MPEYRSYVPKWTLCKTTDTFYLLNFSVLTLLNLQLHVKITKDRSFPYARHRTRFGIRYVGNIRSSMVLNVFRKQNPTGSQNELNLKNMATSIATVSIRVSKHPDNKNYLIL